MVKQSMDVSASFYGTKDHYALKMQQLTAAQRNKKVVNSNQLKQVIKTEQTQQTEQYSAYRIAQQAYVAHWNEQKQVEAQIEETLQAKQQEFTVDWHRRCRAMMLTKHTAIETALKSHSDQMDGVQLLFPSVAQHRGVKYQSTLPNKYQFTLPSQANANPT